VKILFIGGTGIISSACAQLAVQRGFELHLLNRGHSMRNAPEAAQIHHADIRDKDSVRQVLGKNHFDAVVDFIAFTPEHIETDLQLFRGRTDQYIFISSASAYQTPPVSLPITESTPLYNPFWQYSRDKIACEDRLIRAYRDEGFPVTIVRPSHTYDRSRFPLTGGYTSIARMRQGKKVVVHGDGTSLWTLTSNRDFAKGFVGLLGNSHAIGEAFHITSDEILTWDQIYRTAALAAGVEADIVHVSSDTLATYDKEWGDGLLGDKSHSMIFDNTKIKRVVPDFAATITFSRGVQEMAAWHDADPARQAIDPRWDSLIERVIAQYGK
jgi:nucleoside-diphosphate-sugar epimerase